MTLNTLITCVASAYPDGAILHYWDDDKQRAVPNKGGGDTLAEFIALELAETYDAEADTGAQIDTAIRKMLAAVNDLSAVVTALENLKHERTGACLHIP